MPEQNPLIRYDDTGRVEEMRAGDTLPGTPGANAYCYIAYASDASGTGFTNTFNSALDYIAVLSTTTAIAVPAVGDFAGLWKKYKGEAGTNGTNGTNGSNGATGATGPAGATGPSGATGPGGATGPAGATGAKGDTGGTGATGAKGDTGATGPNNITTSTTTNITGIIKGDGSAIAAASPGTDYVAPGAAPTAHAASHSTGQSDAITHNNLAGLNSGDYQHLTAAQLAGLGGGGGSGILDGGTASSTYTGAPSINCGGAT